MKLEPVPFEEDLNFQNNVTVEQPTVSMKEENTNCDSDESIAEQFSPMTTLMCDDQSIESICTVIGSMASHWGYFEREIIYLISKRLEIFFQNVSDTALGKLLDDLPKSYYIDVFFVQILHG